MEISDRYKIIKPLGRQNRRKFGSLFLVSDKVSEELGAMKVVRKDSATNIATERLRAESTFHFDEPGLPKILFTHESDRELIVIRNWIDAVTLDTYFEGLRKRERHDALLHVLERIAGLLNKLHNSGIYHCDLKPGNIMVTKDGKVHLIDFGLALRTPISENRKILFPLGYAAPELLLNRLHLIDQRTDYFALGITLWRLYSGKLPLTHPNPSIFTNLQLTHPLPESNDVPKKIQMILEKMCAKHSFKVPPNTLPQNEVDALLTEAINRRYENLKNFLEDYKNARKKNWFTR